MTTSEPLMVLKRYFGTWYFVIIYPYQDVDEGLHQEVVAWFSERGYALRMQRASAMITEYATDALSEDVAFEARMFWPTTVFIRDAFGC